jgi:predicted DNA-binding protein with PD1-like motif
MKIREINMSRMLFIKLEPNDDILESITHAAKDHKISTGFFTAIGAVNSAQIGYYQMDAKKYKTLTFKGNFEIVSCIGNITLKDNTPLIHAHLIISDENGTPFSGHLLPGCRISVTGEVFLVESQTNLKRELDMQFDLSLIKLD